MTLANFGVPVMFFRWAVPSIGFVVGADVEVSAKGSTNDG